MRWSIGVIVLGLVFLQPYSAFAQEGADTSSVEIGFDDVEEEPLPAVDSGVNLSDIVHFSGRFDVNFEVVNPAESGSSRDSRFRNYHKFLFVKVTPGERVTLDAEVLDLTYYELNYALTRRLNIRAGKIWVPFGSTPFHHYYGGRQGDPFDGLLLPNVWSEFGASIGGLLYTRNWLAVEADVYSIRGFEAELGNVLDFTNGGSDDVMAVGGRTRVGIGSKISLWGSVLYNQFGAGDEGQVLLWGGDVLLDYGLIDLPFLRDLRFRAAFARADIQDELLVSERDNSDHWYFRYGDYAEVSYRGIRFVIPRLRYGTIIEFDDRVSAADSHNWEAALMTRIERNVMVLAQYQFNLEEVNEIDNDLFRFGLIFEF